VADLGEIVKTVERELGQARGAPVALPGGITNHNFRLRFGSRDCVIRVVGRATELLGIDRQAEQLACQAAADLGIAPAILTVGDGYLVTEYLACAPISAAGLRAEPGAVARALRAFHTSGVRLPNRFWVPDLLDGYEAIIRGRGGSLPAEYQQARSVAARIATVLPLEDPVPCHDDLLAANVLCAPGPPPGPMLVDWEYAGMGHRMFDLGNLAVNNEFDEPAELRLLEAYFEERPTPGRRAALALMRIMSDAREAAWGIVQEAVSEVDFDFGDYARRHFDRLRRAAGDSRLEQWLDAATA
jgi:thiamine kinase-like enzyme